MIFTMKLLSVCVIVANIMPTVVVNAFSSASGVIYQRTRIRTQTRTRTRQPSQQPSLLPPLAYLMREGDDVDAFSDDSKKKTTIVPSTFILTSTETGTGTGSRINLNNYVDEKMIEDWQNQHLQMMQMQQQQQQQSSYAVTIPLPQLTIPSTSSPTSAARRCPPFVRLLRSKVSFIRRILLPKNKKQHIERFVFVLIKFVLN